MRDGVWGVDSPLQILVTSLMAIPYKIFKYIAATVLVVFDG
jgi:hypothetical protein